MAGVKLPTYTDLGTAPGADVPQAPTNVVKYDANAPFAAAAQQDEDISKDANQIQDVQTKMQQNAATATLWDKHSEILQQLKEDPNTAPADIPAKYSQMMNDASNQIASTISVPQGRAEWQPQEMAVLNRYTRQAVYDIANQKEKEQGINSIDQTVQNTRSTLAGLDASDPSMQPQVHMQTEAISNQIDLAVQKGWITPQQGNQQKINFMQGVEEDQVLKKIQADPHATATDLSAKILGVHGAQAASLSPDVTSTIQQTAAQYPNQPGMGGYLKATAQLESSGNPNASNGQSQGLFQFQPGTAAQYGVTDQNNVAQSTNGAAALAVDNKNQLTQSLGRQATWGETYLAHQQGVGGATALLQNPQENAIVALTPAYGDAEKAKQAILNNGGTANMTAQQFTDTWNAKFSAASSAPDAGTPATVPGSVLPVPKLVELLHAANAEGNRQDKANSDAAQDAIDKTNQDFVSKWASNQLTANDILGSNLPAVGQAGSKKFWLDQIAAGPDKVDPNDPKVIATRGQIENMKVDNPQAFESMDFTTLAGKLPATDISKFQADATKMRQGDSSMEAQNKRAADIKTAVSDMLPVDWKTNTGLAKGTNQKDSEAFQGNLISAVKDAESVGGKPLGRDDVRKMASDMLGNVDVPGRFFGTNTMPAYQVPSGTNPQDVHVEGTNDIYVPQTFRTGFGRAWQNKRGTAPNESDIRAGYAKSMGSAPVSVSGAQ